MTPPTITFNYDLLDAGIMGLIQHVGIEAPKVVSKETGELIKTLVRISPPKYLARSRFQIKQSIQHKFDTVRDSSIADKKYDGKTGPSGILWYRVDRDFLRGIAPKDDKRDASVDDLAKLRHKISKTGRRVLQFKHPRRHQKVMLRQQILTKKSTVTQLIKRVQTHIGRLKAGWLVSVERGPIRLTGANQPPGWVFKHAPLARGRFIDNLDSKEFPKFLIANSAVGIGNRKLNMPYIVQVALNIRGKAMAENAKLLLSGKKKIADYAK